MVRKAKSTLITDFHDIPDDALIPEDEHPYPIPEHWKWVRLSSIAKINPPKAKNGKFDANLEVSFIPMAAVSEESGTVITHETRPLGSVIKGYSNFLEGDVLFAKITPCMENGKSAIVPPLLNGIGFGSTEFYVLRPSNLVKSSFIHLWVRQRSFRAEAEYFMTGAVGHQRVPKSFLESTYLPLPPLEEQQQIVDYLQASLDVISKSNVLVQETLDQLKATKSGLITAALAGKSIIHYLIADN